MAKTPDEPRGLWEWSDELEMVIPADQAAMDWLNEQGSSYWQAGFFCLLKKDGQTPEIGSLFDQSVSTDTYFGQRANQETANGNIRSPR